MKIPVYVGLVLTKLKIIVLMTEYCRITIGL